jgi:hypothetical protein
MSLNEYCMRVLAAPGPDPAGPGAVVAARAAELFGSDLVGVVLYGSWARGEATAGSDIDVLIVLEPSRPVTRALYRQWDRDPMHHDGHPVEVHIVSLPSVVQASSLWLEAAIDGILVFDRQRRVSRWFSRLRRDIAAGTVVRRTVHGQPYWTVTT